MQIYVHIAARNLRDTMNKKTITIGIMLVFLMVGFCGCMDYEENGKNNPKIINLGESVTHDSIRLTFLSTTWKNRDWSDEKYFYLEIKAENIGNSEDSVFVKITKYEMSNGYSYSNDYIWAFFTVNPGRNNTQEISSLGGGTAGQIIDRDFLPVEKIHIIIDEKANPMVSEVNPMYVIVNL